MALMDGIIAEKKFLPENVSKVSMLAQGDANVIFEKTLPVLIEKVYGEGKRRQNCKRYHEVTTTTLAEKLYRSAKKARREQPNFNPTTCWNTNYNIFENLLAGATGKK
mmetsp:Transcript_23887/g.31227  ORF Transcript_23887/g.31227 Transcript_23887/m.31227 type:complete len:108 (-) Transcript_23887:150-473(-)